MGTNLIDITGKRFGKLVVMSLVPRTPEQTGGSRWLCKCDCGNEIVAWSENIRALTRSCGCIKRSEKLHRQKDITGQKFGRLTAIHKLPKNGNHLRYWLCRCECGTEKAVALCNLTMGKTISCGRAVLGPYIKSRDAKVRNYAATIYGIKEARKRKSGGKFTQAEIDELYKKQKGLCAICLCEIDEDNYHRDHIVPLAKGGTNWISNIQLLCPPCNMKKHDKDPIEYARQIGKLV